MARLGQADVEGLSLWRPAGHPPDHCPLDTTGGSPGDLGRSARVPVTSRASGPLKGSPFPRLSFAPVDATEQPVPRVTAEPTRAGTVWKDPEATRPGFQAGGLHGAQPGGSGGGGRLGSTRAPRLPGCSAGPPKAAHGGPRGPGCRPSLTRAAAAGGLSQEHAGGAGCGRPPWCGAGTERRVTGPPPS